MQGCKRKENFGTPWRGLVQFPAMLAGHQRKSKWCLTRCWCRGADALSWNSSWSQYISVILLANKNWYFWITFFLSNVNSVILLEPFILTKIANHRKEVLQSVFTLVRTQLITEAAVAIQFFAFPLSYWKFVTLLFLQSNQKNQKKTFFHLFKSSTALCFL